MALSKVEICGVNTAKLPLLSNEEKEALFVKIKEGDEAARERYIKGNLRLVLSVIKRFASSNENVDDLFQIGCVGLMKAIDNFNTDLQVKFSTYAVPMIIGEIRRYLRDNNSIRVSRSFFFFLPAFHRITLPIFCPILDGFRNASFTPPNTAALSLVHFSPDDLPAPVRFLPDSPLPSVSFLQKNEAG